MENLQTRCLSQSAWQRRKRSSKAPIPSSNSTFIIPTHSKWLIAWDLTCDELIYCLQGTFRLVVDEISYELNPGDLMFVPKDNHVKYECDEKCVIFYAAYPVDWKQRAGITHVPGINSDDMPTPY